MKSEEIYANDYRDMEHLAARIEELIERYYNRRRLHTALGYRSPEEFEKQTERQNGDEGQMSLVWGDSVPKMLSQLSGSLGAVFHFKFHLME